MVKPSSNSSTVAPTRRSSLASADNRSVSLWRMWATLRIVVGPVGETGDGTKCHHGVTDGVHVDVDPVQPAAADSKQVSPSP